MKEYCVVDVTRMQTYTYRNCEDVKEMEADLEKTEQDRTKNIEMYEKYIVQYPRDDGYWSKCLETEKKKKFEVMTFDEFLERQREYFISMPLTEVTEEVYNDQLDVLPPLHYTQSRNVVMFCMMEMFTGTYTTQYAWDKETGKYWSKMVDVTDRSTWIVNFLREAA